MSSSTSNRKRGRRLTMAVTAKMTPTEHESVTRAAARGGLTVSEFARKILLCGSSASQEARFQMQFSAIGEERIRLIFEAAQKGQKLGSRESLQQVEQEATIAAVELTENRISVLEQLRVTTCGNANNNAK